MSEKLEIKHFWKDLLYFLIKNQGFWEVKSSDLRQLKVLIPVASVFNGNTEVTSYSVEQL